MSETNNLETPDQVVERLQQELEHTKQYYDSVLKATEKAFNSTIKILSDQRNKAMDQVVQLVVQAEQYAENETTMRENISKITEASLQIALRLNAAELECNSLREKLVNSKQEIEPDPEPE